MRARAPAVWSAGSARQLRIAARRRERICRVYFRPRRRCARLPRGCPSRLRRAPHFARVRDAVADFLAVPATGGSTARPASISRAPATARAPSRGRALTRPHAVARSSRGWSMGGPSRARERACTSSWTDRRPHGRRGRPPGCRRQSHGMIEAPRRAHSARGRFGRPALEAEIRSARNRLKQPK
jgi:hypothetical protein